MSEIIYEGSTFDVQVGEIRLNGKDGAIEVFADSEAQEDCDAVITFENANTLFDFIDELKVAALESGFVDGRVDA